MAKTKTAGLAIGVIGMLLLSLTGLTLYNHVHHSERPLTDDPKLGAALVASLREFNRSRGGLVDTQDPLLAKAITAKATPGAP